MTKTPDVTTDTKRDSVALKAAIAQLRDRRNAFTERIAALEKRITDDREARARAVASNKATDATGSASSIAAMKEDVTTLQRSIELVDEEIGELTIELATVEAAELEATDTAAIEAAERARDDLEAALRDFATTKMLPLEAALDRALNAADSARMAFDSAKHRRDGTRSNDFSALPSDKLMRRRSEFKNALDALHRLVGVGARYTGGAVESAGGGGDAPATSLALR